MHKNIWPFVESKINFVNLSTFTINARNLNFIHVTNRSGINWKFKFGQLSVNFEMIFCIVILKMIKNINIGICSESFLFLSNDLL